ncbi:MAG: DNA polymerase III subunit gamma/tau [Phycisphaerae bacterium]
MSYTVLARKFRSQTFDEVIGQSAITTTLKNAILQDRVHHGYLFCGTRGVGKTSMARILAKALNCLSADGPTIDPCGQCDSCVNIARGEDIDVIEIDAASNTGVDNIRDLRSTAIYHPARSRFKIFVIDEVHMLSRGAFNALLKTLEEPPGHVKFIFATTEAHKIPATILSRVQRFDFRSIAAEDIAAQLQRICTAESLNIEEAAAKRLARLANGSMRDALSLLDQVLSMAEKDITAQIVDELFPATHDEVLSSLIDRLADGDAAGALAVVDRCLGGGETPDLWCTRLIRQIRDLMILRTCGPETDLVDVPSALRSQLVEQCSRFDAGTYVYMISVLEELRRIVKSSEGARPLVEAAVIRLVEASNFSSIETLLAHVQPGAPASSTARPPAPRRAVGAKKNAPPVVADRPQQARLARSAAVERPAGAEAPQVPLPPVAGRTTQEDIRSAQAVPIVQTALDLFGGRIVEVQQPRPDSAGPTDPETQDRTE